METPEQVCTPCAAGEFGVPLRCPTWCPSFQLSHMCSERREGATNCGACGRGRASAHTGAVGALSCFACAPGRFSEAPVAAACERCFAGRFAPLPEADACILCGRGEWAPSAAARCTRCLAGRASSALAATTAATCAACPVGTAAEPGASQCDACVPGRADDDSQPASPCVDCSIGQYAPRQATACVACVAGTADTDRSASTPCDECTTGQFAPSMALVCTNCSSGRSDNDSNPASPCVACLPGSYAGVGARTCTMCTNGLADADLSPTTRCQRCGAGRYTEQIVLTGGSGASAILGLRINSCADCAAGRYSAAEGAVSDATCLPCVFGEADSDSSPATPCTVCEPGRFAAQAEAVSCIACKAGLYSLAGAGATSAEVCTPCAPGLLSEAVGASSAQACVPCSAGRYYQPAAVDGDAGLQSSENSPSTQQPAATCQLCPGGHFSDFVGATSIDSCIACAAGRAAHSGSGGCDVCPRGMAAAAAAAECVNCSAGRFAVPGRAQCDSCPPGFFAAQVGMDFEDQDGDNGCDACFGGMFSPGAGSISCVDCGAGRFAAGRGAALCTVCSDGTVSSATGSDSPSTCTDCERGFYADLLDEGGAAAICSACPAGEDTLPRAISCVSCEPSDACIGTGQCSSGYTGEYCSNCARQYFRMNGKCNECPKSNALMIIIAVLVLLLCALLVLQLGSHSRKSNSLTAYGREGGKRVAVSSVPISILLTELQINLRFFQMDVHWPESVRSVMTWVLNFISFDFPALAAPECAIQFSSAGAAYAFRTAITAAILPVFCVCIALLFLIFHSVIAALSQSFLRSVALLLRSVPRETANACVVAWSTMYVVLLTQALHAFHCVPLDTMPGAAWRLDRQREVQCSLQPDGWFGLIFILGSAMLLLYGLAVPCFCFWFLLKQQRRGPSHQYAANDTTAKEIPDADLEASGDDKHAQSFRVVSSISASDDKFPTTDVDSGVIDSSALRLEAATAALENAEQAVAKEDAADAAAPIFCDHRTLSLMGWLFVRFRSSCWYWEFLILGRKAVLAVVVVWLGRSGWPALFLTFLATLIALILQLIYMPFREDYLTYHTEIDYAKERLARLTLRGDSLGGSWCSVWRDSTSALSRAWRVPSLNGAFFMPSLCASP
jgi:hypothetical protein